MNRLDRWVLHLAALLAGGTGLAYGWLRYFGERAGEFGPEAHPWQPATQHLHVLVTPLLVFALGMVVRGHLLPMLRAGRALGRRSGLLLGAVLAPMVLGGYGVQVVVDPGLRRVLAWVHGVPSLLFLGAFGVHALRARLAARRVAPDVEDLPISPS